MYKWLVIFFALLFSLSGMGCSSQGWTARWYVFQAESARGKANAMKERKVTFQERQPLYAKSCRYYIQAYETDESVFMLNRIEEAMDSCTKANLREEADLFYQFEEKYSNEHPREVRYGDGAAAMIDSGG